MSYVKIIAYDVVMAFLSITFFILIILFIIFYRRKSESPKENLPIMHYACSYSLTDIDAATDGFNHLRIIGKGRLGTVYVALMARGDFVAVKRIHSRLVLSNASFGFSTKVKSLSLARHPNVVSILGFSEAPGERIIVTEYVGTMSLDFYLHQAFDDVSFLDWGRRLKVAAGVARGIEYLHEVMVPHVVHGCIKPSNILIDEKFCARVCDYGLSTLASQEMGGLVGYVDEEYWVDRKGGSKESDMYGLGVVLLELLSGRTSEGGAIVRWALPLIKELKFGELLDPRLVMPSNMKSIVRLAKVALACVGNSRKYRPSIVKVVTILNNLEGDNVP
ncbi:hypothetical protein LguiA_014969 [Lonicera macranthoides]